MMSPTIDLQLCLMVVDDAAAPSDAIDMTMLRTFEEMQIEGEPDLIVELIDLYLDDAPVKLASIREAVGEGSAGALRRAAHSLKGSSGSIGAGRVAALCEELEQVACADSNGQAAAILGRLEQSLIGARMALEAERRRRS